MDEKGYQQDKRRRYWSEVLEYTGMILFVSLALGGFVFGFAWLCMQYSPWFLFGLLVGLTVAFAMYLAKQEVQ